MRCRSLTTITCAVVLLLAIQGSFAVRRNDDHDPDIESNQQDDPPPAAQNDPVQQEPTPPVATSDTRHEPRAQSNNDEYDPDEFTTTAREPEKTTNQPPASEKTSSTVQAWQITDIDDTIPPYFLEGFVFCFLILFVVTFFIGKSRNEETAYEWARLVLDDTSSHGLTMNFALVGDNSTRPEKVLMKDSQSLFMMHATGRRHCKSLLATLDLTKRHDLFSVIYNQMFSKPSQTADLLKINIPLNDVAKFCMAICAKGEVKKNKRECSDIKKFTEVVAWKKLPKELVLLTDCEEIIPEILRSEQIYKAFNKLKDLIRVIHISDKSEVDPRYSCMLHLEFQLPALKDPNGPGRKLATDMIQLAIHLIDVVAKASDWQLKHSQVAIKVEQRRAERSKSKRKYERQQEKAQQRKDLKAEQEKEKMENMDPEELRKYEEKKYRQEMKKRMKHASKTKLVKG